MSDVNYGPLAPLIGTWEGNKGRDIAPEPDGQEENLYSETIIFEAIGGVKNAGVQTLAAVRYHQVVCRQSNGEVFHNETGYWIWDADHMTVMQSLTIPRGVCVLAGTAVDRVSYCDTETDFEVQAKCDDASWGILQSPFMTEKAKTLQFNHRMTVKDDEFSYCQTMVLDIYGKSFDHTDENTLRRCQ